MAYYAIVSKIRNVRPTPELRSLNLATINGDQVLVGKDYKEGDLGVYFRGGGIISDQHLKNCNLYAVRGWIVEDPGKSDLTVGQEIPVDQYRQIKAEMTKSVESEIQLKQYAEVTSVEPDNKENKNYVVNDPKDSTLKFEEIVNLRKLRNSKSQIDKENAKLIKDELTRRLPKGKTVNRGGSFESNRRVRTVKFQGVESHGFWQPLTQKNANGDNVFNFAWTGEDASWFTEGKEFDSVGNYRICEKYYTKAERNAIAERDKRATRGMKTVKGDFLMQHYETPQLRNADIPEGSVVVLTEKLHGTSGRTGYVPEDVDLTGFPKWWNTLAEKHGWALRYPTQDYKYISGTRRVIMNEESTKESGYYDGTTFRSDIHRKIQSLGLKKGETLYYEIVGYTEVGVPIMAQHKVKDEKLKKRFGQTMTYTYGCKKVEDTFMNLNSHINPRDFIDAMKEKMGWDVRLAECKIYVYRITNINPDGEVIELSWDAVKRRCSELGLNYVPELTRFIHDGDNDKLTKLCVEHGTKTSTLDSSHLMEGVCIRVSNYIEDHNYKFKNFFFKQQEDIMKDDEHFVDPEDIA